MMPPLPLTIPVRESVPLLSVTLTAASLLSVTAALIQWLPAAFIVAGLLPSSRISELPLTDAIVVPTSAAKVIALTVRLAEPRSTLASAPGRPNVTLAPVALGTALTSQLPAVPQSLPLGAAAPFQTKLVGPVETAGM